MGRPVSRLTQLVRAKLDSFGDRQRARDAARHFINRRSKIYRLRATHKLDNIHEAKVELNYSGYEWTEESYYGVKILHVEGVTIAYDRTGQISWSTKPPREEPPEQQLMFNMDGSVEGPVPAPEPDVEIP